jgi:hypothetical protein
MTWNDLAERIARMSDTELELPVVAVRECPEDYDKQLRVLRVENLPQFYESPTLILQRE